MIKLSKKWDYGLKAISYLAGKKWTLVTIGEISKELAISETFLRRIVNDFEKADLLKTIKWRNGGVILERELRSISLYDIFSSLWEDLSITNCTAGMSCKNDLVRFWKYIRLILSTKKSRNTLFLYILFKYVILKKN